MRSSIGRWAAAASAAVALAVAAVCLQPTARGAAGGSATGELGAGGTARGDISTTPGERDEIGVDALAGQKLNIALVSNFRASIAVFDPTGAQFPMTFTPGYVKISTPVVVAASGRYVVTIASSDGSQGTYTLTASAKWPGKTVTTSASGASVDFAMPAGASVTATIKASPAKSWNPQIASLIGPGGASLLSAPIVGAKGVVKLPKTTATATGAHALTIEGGPQGAVFRATVVVKSPVVQPTSIDLRNGLTPVTVTNAVSFSKDGVAQIFMTKCGPCHGWAWSYAGVQPAAQIALSYIQAGVMPLGGPPLSSANVTLIKNWIKTGENP